MMFAAAALLAGPAAAADLYGTGSRASACIALTFDDGPDPQLTPRLLDLLASEGVRATFYLVGEAVVAAPAIAARIAAEGHEIGNHSWSHPLLPRLSTEGVAAELAAADAAIAAATGVWPATVRPPKGAYDDAVLHSAGRPVILWSVATLDWLHEDVDFAVSRATRRLGPGTIVLMHDVQPIVVAETAGIIAAARARGLGFSTVSELLAGAPCGA